MGKPLVIILCVVGFIVLFFILRSIFSSGAPIPQPNDASTNNNCFQPNDTYDPHYLIPNNLDQLQLRQESSDIKLVAQNMVFKAHKLILAAHSKYFEEQLAYVNSSNRFNVSNVDNLILSVTLEFIYGGSLPDDFIASESYSYNLLRTANDFQLDSLKCELSKYLQNKITAKNIGDIISLAEESQADYLRIAASNYLVENFKTIRDTPDWKATVSHNKHILTKAFDVHGKLPANSICKIVCQPSNFKTKRIFENLHRFFDNEQFSDAEVIVKEENGTNTTLKVNKAILIAQSDVFKRQFAESPKSVQVDGVSASVMKEFLGYMYSGYIPKPLTGKLVEDLLYLSHFYEMDALKRKCEDNIISKINVENAAKTAIVADRAQSKRISTNTLDFILKNIKEVVKTPGWAELKENQPDLLTKIF